MKPDDKNTLGTRGLPHQPVQPSTSGTGALERSATERSTLPTSTPARGLAPPAMEPGRSHTSMAERPKLEKTTKELEAEAARMRGRLKDDVRALKEKMTPENVKQQAKDALVHTGQRATERLKHLPWVAAVQTTRAVNRLIATARARPLATASVSVGIGVVLVGWFASARRRHQAHSREVRV